MYSITINNGGYLLTNCFINIPFAHSRFDYRIIHCWRLYRSFFCGGQAGTCSMQEHRKWLKQFECNFPKNCRHLTFVNKSEDNFRAYREFASCYNILILYRVWKNTLFTLNVQWKGIILSSFKRGNWYEAMKNYK